jgi:hypothetical protein
MTRRQHDRDPFSDRYAEASHGSGRDRSDNGRAFPQVSPVSWAWLDLNQRPHPQVKIPARGGKLPGTYQGRRGPCPLRGAVTAQGPSRAAHLHPSGVAAGHEPLIRDRGLSAVRTSVSPGRARASGAKGCVLTAARISAPTQRRGRRQGMPPTRRRQGDGAAGRMRQPHRELIVAASGRLPGPDLQTARLATSRPDSASGQSSRSSDPWRSPDADHRPRSVAESCC